MMNEAPSEGTHAQGGGYGPPPGGYGPPGGAPPGAPPGGYGPPGGGAPPGAPPGGYGPPPGGAPMPPPGGGPMLGGAPMGGDIEALKKQLQTWLIIGLVAGFCCGGGLISLVGALLAFLGGQSAQRGDIADAQSKLKIGKILVIVGLALGVILIGLWFALSGLSMLSNM